MKNKIIYPLLLLLIPILLIAFKEESGIKLGIIQIVEHESLNNLRQGFLDELENLGIKNINVDLQIASGDFSNCNIIAQKFVSEKKDLILAISTPCAQSVANATQDIPILATAITNFEDAGIVKSDKYPQTNVTGTSDLAPIEKIINLIPKLKPDVKTIGILYSDIESSPKYQAKISEKAISNMGFTSKEVAISQANDVQQATEKIVKEVDALYVPIDNITASCMPQITKIFLDNGKFVVCAESSMISKGVVATYGMNYYDLGKLTAKQAVQILEHKNIPQNMPIEYMSDSKLSINEEVLNKLNIEIPEELKGEIK